MIRYQARIYRDGKGYSVMFPDLPGCVSAGRTKEEARCRAREALSLYLEEARDPDWEVPVAKTRRGRTYEWVHPFPDVAVPLLIRQVRRKHKLSQRQFARKLSMTVQQLQKLETPGKSNPTVKTLAAISEALEEQLEVRLSA